MKRKLDLLLALAMTAGLCLPAFAQDEAAAPKDNPAAEAPAEIPSKPAPKKPAPKKKAKKKKKPAPASEYKFTSVDKTETYKFDKKANPIIKEKKKKKPAKKAPAAKESQKAQAAPAAKLKPAKAIGEAQQTAGEQNAAEQAGGE